MTCTYDPTLPTDKDFVRFNIGDRDVRPGKAKFEDEEIQAVVDLEGSKWLAAARMGETLLAQNRGVTSKSVDGLSLSFGDSPESAYSKHLQRLREEGCRQRLLEDNQTSVLKVL